MSSRNVSNEKLAETATGRLTRKVSDNERYVGYYKTLVPDAALPIALIERIAVIGGVERKDWSSDDFDAIFDDVTSTSVFADAGGLAVSRTFEIVVRQTSVGSDNFLFPTSTSGGFIERFEIVHDLSNCNTNRVFVDLLSDGNDLILEPGTSLDELLDGTDQIKQVTIRSVSGSTTIGIVVKRKTT